MSDPQSRSRAEGRLMDATLAKAEAVTRVKETKQAYDAALTAVHAANAEYRAAFDALTEMGTAE